MKKICLTCRFWGPYRGAIECEKLIGWCCIRAPVLTLNRDGESIRGWPKTWPKDFCGEWESGTDREYTKEELDLYT